jgi:hypothetical protein
MSCPIFFLIRTTPMERTGSGLLGQEAGGQESDVYATVYTLYTLSGATRESYS